MMMTEDGRPTTDDRFLFAKVIAKALLMANTKRSSVPRLLSSVSRPPSPFLNSLKSC